MDYSLLWKAIIIVVGGTLLLRIAGRKSISQMTLAQTVIMVGIGSLLVQPIAGEDIWSTLAVGAVLVITLFILELIQVKSDSAEKLITGKSKVLIENGKLKEKNLKKLRMTVDQLEMNLRQQNVAKISDVEWATLEPNGQVGFILKKEAQPATKQEIQALQKDLQQLKELLLTGVDGHIKPTLAGQNDATSNSLFEEVEYQSHEKTPPKHLQ